MIFFLTPLFLESDALDIKDFGAETGNEVAGFSSFAQRAVFCPIESYNQSLCRRAVSYCHQREDMASSPACLTAWWLGYPPA